jgi:hypothetical protein
MPDPGTVRAVAGKQAGTGGRAGGADMILGETVAQRMKNVELRCFYPGISVASKIAISLIIGKNKYNIRLFPRHKTISLYFNYITYYNSI